MFVDVAGGWRVRFLLLYPFCNDNFIVEVCCSGEVRMRCTTPSTSKSRFHCVVGVVVAAASVLIARHDHQLLCTRQYYTFLYLCSLAFLIISHGEMIN